MTNKAVLDTTLERLSTASTGRPTNPLLDLDWGQLERECDARRVAVGTEQKRRSVPESRVVSTICKAHCSFDWRIEDAQIADRPVNRLDSGGRTTRAWSTSVSTAELVRWRCASIARAPAS